MNAYLLDDDTFYLLLGEVLDVLWHEAEATKGGAPR
jgi:hypothetical protein